VVRGCKPFLPLVMLREIKTLGGTTGVWIGFGGAAIATPGVARGCKPFLSPVLLREIKTLGDATGASIGRGDDAIATPGVARGFKSFLPLVMLRRLIDGLFPSLVFSVVMTVDFSFPACRLFRSVRELFFRSMSCY